MVSCYLYFNGKELCCNLISLLFKPFLTQYNVGPAVEYLLYLLASYTSPI